MWDTFVGLVKDCGTIAAFIIVIFALCTHWKSIFHPHEKKLEEKEFTALEELLIDVRNHELLWLYSAAQTIKVAALRSMLKPISDNAASPFLPPHISKKATELITAFFSCTNFPMLIYLTEGNFEESEDVTIIDKDGIFKKHQALHDAIASYMHLRQLSFPFTLEEKSAQQSNAADAFGAR